MNAALRNLLVPVHRWSGLTIGFVIVFMAITGAGMVFKPQLEPILSPKLVRVEPCNVRVPLDTMAVNARAVFPDGRLDYFRVSPEPNAALMARFTNKEGRNNVFVDPCTGNVLGTTERYGWVFGKLEYLHRFKWMPNGNLVTGISVIVFAIILAIGGILLWWPPIVHAIGKALRFNPRLSGRAATLNRHQTVGAYASLIVLGSALTGLPSAYEWYKNGVDQLFGATRPVAAPRSALPASAVPQAAAPESAGVPSMASQGADLQASVPTATGAERMPIELIWRRAQATTIASEARDAMVYWPQKPSDPVKIDVLERTSPYPQAWSTLYFDAYTGKLLRSRPYADTSGGSKALGWALALHMGQVGGWFGQLVLFAATLCIPYLAYSGFSSWLRRKSPAFAAPGIAHLSVKVVAKKVEAQDICTFELADPSGKALPPFSAGSHIDVLIRDGLTRQYSLCNDPRESHRYLIGVLRDPNSRGGSAAMHDDIEEGELIEIGEPKNHFPLAHSAAHSLLIAGGIGITPILCMAERLGNIGADFRVHYCTRSRARTAFVDRIEKSPYASKVQFHFDDGAPGQRTDLTAMLANPSADKHLYVCGPTGFMDAVIATARTSGWAETHIHREYFAAPAQSTAGDREFEVRIASTGRVYKIARDQTVVAALAAHGITIPTSCGEGVCGTCATRVLEGEPEHRDLYMSAEEHAKNERFTPCCSRAKSLALVLDL